MNEETIANRFERALQETTIVPRTIQETTSTPRVIPEQREIVRPDGSTTIVNHYNVVVNYGTRDQNHTFRSCSCGCGHGCGILDSFIPTEVTPSSSWAIRLLLLGVIAFGVYEIAPRFL